MSAEDDRAAAYRAQQAARWSNKQAAEAALVTDQALRQAAWDGWKALLPLDEFGNPIAGVPADDCQEAEAEGELCWP